MLAGVCVGGCDRGVGEVVVFSMGTRLLTAATQQRDNKQISHFQPVGTSVADAHRRRPRGSRTHLP